MDIRLLESHDMKQAKALWKQAFNDSDAFINTYFKNKILPGNSLGLFNGRLVSVVHMLPYKICVQGRTLQSAFIAGAATDQSFRGQGHMRTLLHESLQLMRQRGILMTHLYPFKHSFYENFGWGTYSFVKKRKVVTGELNTDVVETTDVHLLQPIYLNMLQSLDGYVIRGEREWNWRLEELFSDGGKAIALFKNNVPIAYMLYYNNNGDAEAIETVYTDISDAHALANHLAGMGFREVRYHTSSQDIGDMAYGMARVVDAQKLLEQYDAEVLLENVRITDRFAEWNEIGNPYAPDSIDISMLAQLVHRGVPRCQPGDTNANAWNHTAAEIFIQQDTCIFEEY